MSFGESMFSAGFIQKIVKGDLNVKGKIRIPPWNQLQKVSEDSRSHVTEAEDETVIGGAARPHMGPLVNLVAMSISHRL